MITLTDGSTVISLAADMQWVDEYQWLPTAQQVDVTFDGALIVEESAQQAGRPITLEARIDFGWLDRTTLDALRALAVTPRTTPMLLTLEDTRTFNVLFRHGAGLAVDAQPIQHIVPFAAGDFYTLTLKLLQV